MKKFFTMALMSLAFVACNKEENKETPKEEIEQETPKEEVFSIEGAWGIESFIFTENGQTHTEEPDRCEKKDIYTFTAETFSFSGCTDNEQGECECKDHEKESYTISGDKISIKGDEGEEDNVFTFTVDKNTLKLIDERGTIVLKRK